MALKIVVFCTFGNHNKDCDRGKYLDENFCKRCPNFTIQKNINNKRWCDRCPQDYMHSNDHTYCYRCNIDTAIIIKFHTCRFLF